MLPLARLRTRLGQLAARLDAVATSAAGAAPLASWPLAYATAIGPGAFVAAHPGAIAALAGNRVPRPQALEMVVWAFAALVALGAVYAGVIARGRRLGAPAGAAVADLNRLLRPVLALPLVEALAAEDIERDRPGQTMLLVALVAAIAGASVYGWPRAGGAGARPDGAARPPREAGARAAAALFVSALWAGYALFFSRLSILNHRALNTRTISLGFYDNIFYHSAHGHPLGCSFMKAGHHGSAHFDPILVLLSPIYLLYPRAELLLALQSVWLGAGVVPVYLLTRARLASRPAAAALAAMFAMYPALHGANLYELHSLTLVVPITLWLLYFLERGAGWGYWIALAAALLVREDVPILMGFVGVYAVLSRRPRAGWITILASVSYFAAVKRWGMTSPDIFMTGNDAYAFAFNYEDLIPNHDGAGGLLTSLLTNPAFVLGTMVTAPKILYLAMLFVPLGFLPFFARPGRVMLAWGLLFCLLASRPALYAIHFHYACVIIPVAFALVPAALRRIEDSVAWPAVDGRRASRALLVAALTASLLGSWKLGGFVENGSFRAGYLPVARALSAEQRDTYAWVREQVDRLPGAARVGVTNRTGAHCSNRSAAFLYPEHTDVDWLFIDEAELDGARRDAHQRNVGSGLFEPVARRSTLALYRRRSP